MFPTAVSPNNFVQNIQTITEGGIVSPHDTHNSSEYLRRYPAQSEPIADKEI